MVKVFLVPALKDNAHAQMLAKDFRRFKQGLAVEYMSMGKDVPFHYPSSAVMAELQHVHLIPLDSHYQTSDEFLVYTQGFNNPECYLILAIFSPNAHEISNDTLLMASLADVAENFRSQF
mgnify:CR=1 FL=1